MAEVDAMQPKVKCERTIDGKLDVGVVRMVLWPFDDPYFPQYEEIISFMFLFIMRFRITNLTMKNEVKFLFTESR